jgi:hypothetical protein
LIRASIQQAVFEGGRIGGFDLGHDAGMGSVSTITSMRFARAPG